MYVHIYGGNIFSIFDFFICMFIYKVLSLRLNTMYIVILQVNDNLFNLDITANGNSGTFSVSRNGYPPLHYSHIWQCVYEVHFQKRESYHQLHICISVDNNESSSAMMKSIFLRNLSIYKYYF